MLQDSGHTLNLNDIVPSENGCGCQCIIGLHRFVLAMVENSTTKEDVRLSPTIAMGKTADTIWSACKFGDLTTLKSLLQKHGMEHINKKQPGKGYSAVQFASAYGHLDIVQYLVKNNADINACDDEGDTPLHDACYMANLDVIKFLVEQQADVMATNARNQTPLDRAIISGDHEVIAYIRNTPAERTRRWKMLRKIIITLSILAAGIAVCVAHFHVLEL